MDSAHTNFPRDPRASISSSSSFSPLRQVRPGPAGREIQRESADSHSSSPLQTLREGNPPRLGGGDATPAGNGGDGGRRRRYAGRREPRLLQRFRHRHTDPGEPPPPALRIVVGLWAAARNCFVLSLCTFGGTILAGGEIFNFILPPIGKLSVSIVTAQLLMLEGFTLGKPS